MKKQGGFTLLELVVVLAILGIILSIAVPNYLGINENANNNAQGIQAELIAKSLQQEFSDDFANVNEDTSKLMVDVNNTGTYTAVTGFKIDSDAPIRGHLCFTYLEEGDPTSYPYFSYTLDTAADTLTIEYEKSAGNTLDDLAVLNYY